MSAIFWAAVWVIGLPTLALGLEWIQEHHR